MAKSRLFVLVCPIISLVDLCATAFIFARGNNWKLLWKSAENYTFSTSFVDFWLLAVLRTSFIIGGTIGIIKNPADGPKNCKKYDWMVLTVTGINLYFACIKLLVFSHDVSFVAGPKLNWFWVIFAWSNFGALVFLLQWEFFSRFKCSFPNQVYIEEPDLENLLKKTKNGECSKKKSPDDKNFTELANNATIKKMLSFSVPDWWLIAIGFIFLIGAAVGEIFLPLYTGRIITAIVAPEKNDQFLTIIFEIAMISVAVSICTGLRGGVMTYYIDRLNLRIRNALFSSILHQEIGFFDEQRTGVKCNNMSTGDITSRLTSDTTTMSDTIGLEFNVFLRSMIKGVGVCVFMFALSWRMSLITFMGFPLIFSASKVYGKYYKVCMHVMTQLTSQHLISNHPISWSNKLSIWKQVQDKFAKANEVAQEVCSSMQTVRSFANEKSEAAQYKLRLKDVLKIQIKQAVSYSFYQWCTESFELLLIVFTLWYGGYLIVMGKLPSANFISFILYQEELGNCFSEIGDVYTGIMQALGAAEKVFELIERKPLLSLNDGTEEPSCIKGHIAFKNVSFAYPSRPDQLVLEVKLYYSEYNVSKIHLSTNLSFEVQPGEVVALVGPSGGGKSSCVKLIQRFYEPTAGEIMLDGISVSSYKHQFLHEKVSLVGQEPVLYARSIRKNIIYGLEDDQYTDESILNASKLANSHNFIMELRDGYNTESGEKGIQLSGGQKQRVAIARALVRNPSVLLLDEATSALDTESEYLVQEALERSKSHRTVLLIAHRLSTVERADRIVVIVKGKVEEIGSHSELMAKQGTYYNLVYR
uniref:Uncharacterized protein n=1 Tax=Ciona savignyi TaxID=51511 RepID=H2Z4F1_CIOSA